MMVSKTLTETLLLKKPKNPKTIPSIMVCQSKVFDNDGILYIVDYSRVIGLKTLSQTITI